MSAYTKPDVSQLDIDKTFFYGFRTKFLDKNLKIRYSLDIRFYIQANIL